MQLRIRPLRLSGDPSEDRAAFIGCVIACLLVFGGLLLASQIATADPLVHAHAPIAPL